MGQAIWIAVEVMTVSKTSRNAPCPCGSGKKYKKCCLPKEQASVKPPARDEQASKALATLGVGRHSALRLLGIQQSEGRKSAKKLWTPQKVSSMGVEEILERLRNMGIEVDEESFVPLTEGLDSAWPIADVWQKRIDKRLDDESRDFLALAAVNLWRHWVSERLCVEAIDDWMQEGYAMDGDDAAVDKWIGLWSVLRSMGMKTTDELDEYVGGTQHVGNWLQDLCIAFLNASLKDPQMAWRGAEFARQVVEGFAQESEGWLSGFECDRAQMLFGANRRDLAEPILRRLIEQDPDDPGTYMRLAEGLTDGTDVSSEDRRAAIELVERARARCNRADDFGAADLLVKLRAQG
jgi:hypothetical protein